MSMSNPDLPPGAGEKPKLSPLAQTFEVIKAMSSTLIVRVVTPVQPPPPKKERDMDWWYELDDLLSKRWFKDYQIGVLLELKVKWGSRERWG